MRVAVVSLGSPDYLPDIVADGLIRLLGRQNVYLHFSKTAMGSDIRYTHLMAGFFDQPNSFPFYDADALVISNRSGGDIARTWIAHTGRNTIGLLDGEDDISVREDLRSFSKIYFKREYLKGQAYPANVRPLPFAAIPEEPTDRVPIERTVFFMGHYNDHPVRKKIGDRLAYMGFPIATATWPKADYNRALRGSMIGVSVRGWGWDTYRYWEIPYFGTCLLSEVMPIEIPGNFKDGEEAVFYTDENDMGLKLGKLLAEPERAKEIGARGRQACLERHMSIHRAKTVLEALA